METAEAAQPLGIGPGFARRAIDVVVAILALTALAVPLAIVALAIRLDSSGPALYRQRRIGQGRSSFDILKFRTMTRDAPGPALTGPDDRRITRVGRFLRISCIDELPQLVNVLRGHMTLVGARPQTPDLASRYPRDLAVVFRYRPGLTGPGVLNLNDDDVLPDGMPDIETFYLREVVPLRVRMDLEYLRNPTLRRTMSIVGATASCIPRRLFGKPVRDADAAYPEPVSERAS